MTDAPDPLEAILLPGFCTGVENLQILKCFAPLCGPRVLDIGCYRGGAALALALMGKEVEAITMGPWWPKRVGPVLERFGGSAHELAFEARKPDALLDGIWASHVLEHAPNPGHFLARAWASLRPEGWLAVVVPPFKPKVVMGHISPGWNLGILMYALAAAGFDPARGHFLRHGYNLAGFVPKAPRRPARHEDAFKNPALWPFAFDPAQGFDGDLAACNWPEAFRARMEGGLSALLACAPDVAEAASRDLAATWRQG